MNPQPTHNARKVHGLKDHKQQPFLEAFARLATDTAAAKAVGISRYLVMDWKKRDPAFLAAYKDIHQTITDTLVETAYEMAVRQGNTELIKFLLRARDPQTYSERITHEIVSEQLDKIFSLVMGALKRTVPQPLWGKVAVELGTIMKTTQLNVPQATLQ